jgi:hypothetical protein
MEEEVVHLYGFTSTPLVRGFVVVGSASSYKDGWLVRSLFDDRNAIVEDEKAAIVWLQEWCSATAIIEGSLVNLMEHSHQE